MALSGTISKFITGREYRIEWSATQNIAGNYSDITCVHKLINNAYYDLYINSRSNTCTVDGESKSYTSDAISTTGGSTITLGTTTHRVYHNSDGSKSVTITGTFNIQATLAGSYVSSITASQSVTLDKIPRAAQITSAPNFTDEENPTITYANNAGTIVSKIEACITNADGTTIYAAYREISTTANSYTFSLTDAERQALQAACTGKSMTVCFYLKTTLAGDTYYTYVYKTLTIANAEPTLAPAVSEANSTAASLTGDANKLIKYASNANFAFNAQAKKGASITSYSLVCGSKSANTATGTLEAIDSGTFIFSVTDSRGYTVSQTISKELVAYFYPTANIKVGMPTAAGVANLKVTGTCFNGSFGAVENTCDVQYRHSTDNGTRWSEWQSLAVSKNSNSYSINTNITGLDYKKAHTFQARIIDKLATRLTDKPTVRTIPVYDWGESHFNVNVPFSASQSITAGDEAATVESQVSAESVAGDIYLYAQGTADGVRGICSHSADGSELPLAHIDKDNKLYLQNQKAYYESGDSEYFWLTTAGFVTSDAKELNFTIPLAKPILGNPTISIEAVEGFKIRQWNSYLYGSSAGAYAIPASISAGIYGTNTINSIDCYASFDDNTGATNNAPVGVACGIRVTFS